MPKTEHDDFDVAIRREAIDDPELIVKILEITPVGITVVDKSGRITFANQRAEEILGLTRSQISGRAYNDPEWRITTHEGDPFPDEDLPFQKVRDTGAAVKNVRHAIVWPDGRTVCLSINASMLITPEGGFAGIVASIEDVTDACKAERTLRKKNRPYTVIRLCNKALVHATDETSLLQEICRIIVQDGGYRLAWVGYIDDSTGKEVKPVAQHGYEAGYLDSIVITWDDSDNGRGPTGTAIRTGVPASSQYILNDPAFTPWREQALKRGYASSLSLPLIADSHTLGALNIYAAEPDAFDPEEKRLLMQMADDLAYGVNALRVREERMQNLLELHESREGLKHANIELVLAYDETIEGWSRALDLRDKETEGHTLRVTEMTVRLARARGIDEAGIAHIRRGALLHDIGKMGVPDRILLKPGQLTEDEWVIMRQHPQFALDMLTPIGYLHPALDIPGCHHERWDGTGYPRGLQGEQIPLAARLFAVVDVWDALRSDRPYRPAWPEAKVLEHIRAGAGTHFDPEVVDLSLRTVGENSSGQL